MYKTRSAFLTLAIFAISTLQALSGVADTGQQSSAPAKAMIDTLPPVGKGQNMVLPYQNEAYQKAVPGPVRAGPDHIDGYSRDQVRTPLSREIVPPSYRYGSPGYMPDGRGGRGYDYGYPGYRDQGGGGYPHHRQR